MGLAAGTKLGPYEITALIGAGGMGEVYRSRDTKLKRDVAIKVLPAEFSRDPDRMLRFRREAEVLATLNHPHIAQIYGLEESGDTLCLVLELAEGETLAEQLRRGPLPLDEALRIAHQITEALEAAHERSIVHRDLKPANIKITPDGQVKVLDFGLAKAMASEVMEPSTSHSPTMLGGTMQGVILGTAAYMSPEQAKGRQADARSDIWAFGCVLYEMLTGKAGFNGETTIEILGEVMKSDLDWNALPAMTPPAVRSLLKRCLQKDRTRRLHSIADARLQLDDAINEPATSLDTAAPRRSGRERFWMAIAATMFVAAAALGILYIRRSPADAPEMRLQIVTGPAADAHSFAISPDGLKIVYQGALEGKPYQLFLRPLASDVAQPLAGTEGGFVPFWSPDSRSVGFVAGGQLKRIDIDSGSILTLSGATFGNGSWNADGTILFARAFTGPLFRIRSGGGEPTEVTRLNAPQQTSHFRPSFLPDGNHFLFFAYGAPEIRGIYVGSLDSKETRLLFKADAGPVFAPPDYVLFHRQGALVAQKLDLGKLQPVGDPVLVSKQVAWDFGNVVASISASASGTIAYRTSDAERQFAWFDRTGRQIETIGSADANAISGSAAATALSPDGRIVALARTVGGNIDIWLTEIATGVAHPFTLDALWNCCPIWSPDGKRIAFATDPKGPGDIYLKPVDGSEPQTPLLASEDDKNLRDWSQDGRFILFVITGRKTGNDLWVLPLEGNKTPFPIANTKAEEGGGRFSPDGHWIAIQSNDTGRSEIYLQPFPGPGSKRQITNNGGGTPMWRRDGRELFYSELDGRLMSVAITSKGSSVEAGRPVALFTRPPLSDWDPAPDGQRFLINKVVKDPAPITVVLNWKPPQ